MKKLLTLIVALMMVAGAAYSEAAFDSDFDITLSSDQGSEYAREIVLGKGTVNEYTITGYFVPKAVYDVTNLSDTAVQISIYGEQTTIDDGIEYPGDVPEQHPVVLMPGASNQIKVLPGTYIKCPDGDFNVGLKVILYLEMQN